MRGLVACLALCVATPAFAGPKLLVLRAESTVDWETRTRVEDLVMGLARNVDRGVGQSETSFKAVSDMIGCRGDLAACKGQVVETLSVDEVVAIDIGVAATGKIKVTVHRASKSGARQATVVVERAHPDKGIVATIGPLFDAKKVIAAPSAPNQPAKPPAKGNVAVGGAGVVVDNEEPPPRGQGDAAAGMKSEQRPSAPIVPVAAPANKPPPPPAPTTVASSPESSTVTAAPDNVISDERPMSRTTKIGIATFAGGVVLTTVGVVLWSKASNLEDDIQSAPNRTQDEVDALLEMEQDADRYALFGNITFVAGLAVAGVGAYFVWRGHRERSSAHARITPMVLGGGGGVVFTWGAP
jgi:hypothetical protein